MAIYNWSDGERLTAEKLNSWSAEIEGIKTTVEGYKDDTEEFKNSASGSSASASASKDAAALSESNAATSEANALSYKNEASASATTSSANKLDSEAWAVGTRGGVPVSSGDPAYHNNAKYYKDQAGEIVGGDYATKTEFNAHTGNTTVHITATERNTWNGKANMSDIPDISGKANKPTISTFTLLASGWSGSTYDLGNAGSNLEIELDASATEEMVEAWSNAKMVGSATSNVLTAKGDVPTIDITCILRKVVQ